MAKSEGLPFSDVEALPFTQWFSSRGSVVRRGSTSEVFVGGTLIGSFEDGEQLERNAILVQLSEDPKCHLGRLADAFDVSSERLRQLRRLYEEGGIAALRPGEAGGPRRLSERDVARFEKLFEQGVRPREAHEKIKRGSLSTITRAFRAWRAARDAKPVAPPASSASAASRTMTLPGIEMLPTPRASVSSDPASDDLRGGSAVQHVGTWIMIAMLERLGLYSVAQKVRSRTRSSRSHSRRTRRHDRVAEFDGTDGSDVAGIAFVAGPKPGKYDFQLDDVALR